MELSNSLIQYKVLMKAFCRNHAIILNISYFVKNKKTISGYMYWILWLYPIEIEISEVLMTFGS